MIRRRPLPTSHGERKALRYGENPHQKAYWQTDARGARTGRWQVHQGKELSYTNLLDLDAAARIALEFSEPAGGRDQAHQSVRRRDRGDRSPRPTCARARPIRCPRSAASSAVNRPLDADTARALTSTFIEAVIAPAVDEEAKPILATKAEPARGDGGFREAGRADAVRADRGSANVSRRHAAAGARSGDRGAASRGRTADYPKVVTKRAPHRRRVDGAALRVAGLRAREVERGRSSPTADRTLAIGAGQMSRVDAVNVAVMKAQRRAAGIGRRLRRVLPVPGRPRRASPRPGPPRSCSRADRCATRK